MPVFDDIVEVARLGSYADAHALMGYLADKYPLRSFYILERTDSVYPVLGAVGVYLLEADGVGEEEIDSIRRGAAQWQGA